MPGLNNSWMETTVTILRELWQRRIYVGVAAVVAILVGVMLAYRLSLPPESRQYDVGMASAHILVDTPQSQVVDVSPRGSGSLGTRANLLANLMTEGEVKAAIARRAGLRPNELLAGVDAGTGLPPDLAAAAGDRDSYLLTTHPETNSDGCAASDHRAGRPGSRPRERQPAGERGRGRPALVSRFAGSDGRRVRCAPPRGQGLWRTPGHRRGPRSAAPGRAGGRGLRLPVGMRGHTHRPCHRPRLESRLRRRMLRATTGATARTPPGRPAARRRLGHPPRAP